MPDFEHDLKERLEEIRSFLVLRWSERAAEMQLVPRILSEGMCGFSSAFLLEVLPGETGEEWRVVGGIPVSEAGTPLDSGGIMDAEGKWQAHYWLVNDAQGLIVDLTSDQFGFDPVVVVDDKDPRYSANYHDHEVAEQMRAVSWRARQWIRDWRSRDQMASPTTSP